MYPAGGRGNVTALVTYTCVWDALRRAFDHVANGSGSQPIIVSSLPHPDGVHDHGTFPLVLVPPGRMVAVAIGLRGARPENPLILVGAADSMTLGTNHLIHAARRNIGLTLVLLRSDLLASPRDQGLDRSEWAGHASAGPAGRPLEWATALQANFVARSSIADPEHLGATLLEATATPGFSVVGVTDDPALEDGVISRASWPEHFAAYRASIAGLARPAGAPARTERPTVAVSAPSRLEVRIAGFGGQGIKLAGTILSHAAGIEQGLWATHHGVYGAATRGGRSRVDIVLGSDPITYPGVDHADVLVLLDGTAVETYGSTSSASHVVVDESLAGLAPPGALVVPIIELAREHAGSPLAAGVTSLGCLAALIGSVPLAPMLAAARTHLPAAMVDRNLSAMRAAYERTLAEVQRGVVT